MSDLTKEQLDKKLEHYRLSHSEYEMICDRLGRAPEGVEWALFSALWSEHCSYKSSKVHLKKFYSQSSRVLQSFGENAGVIDLGEGERVAFKMESHNHPSYIAPYQGAATGVGGILRDIFTMGARPIALANYLCFGQPQAERMESLVDGVVRGIGGYGNCVGVPTITGQTEFHSSYDGNILVNALALGLFRPEDKVFTAKASGVGNYVVYVGAKTGRDGVHGASMASESFDEGSESKKPTVQIGDPFYEKLLIESCLEVMKEDLVVAIQDMGAAGLTSSSFEMASHGGVGFEVNLDKVPSRDEGITPEEVLLSESQERMLLICEPKNFERLQSVFEKWALDAVVIGEVTEKKTVHLKWGNKTLCEIDPGVLVDNAPMYEREYQPWSSPSKVSVLSSSSAVGVETFLEETLGSIQGTGRSWVYDQYDQRVGGKTHRDASESVGVLILPDSQRALGLVLGCRPHVMRTDAYLGGQDAIAYPALELAAKGFQPLAVTDCLNFGNPEKPEVMSEFVAAVEGMNEVCKALDTPVISGNVSFYNETLDKNVTSTPSTGVVGLRPRTNHIPCSFFEYEGDYIYVLTAEMFKMSGLYNEIQTGKNEFSGELNLSKLSVLVDDLQSWTNDKRGVSGSRVVGKFGLAYTLARMTERGRGAFIEVDPKTWDNVSHEVGYQVVLVVKPKRRDWIEEQAENSGWSLDLLGEVKGNSLYISEQGSMPISQIKQKYYNSWEKNFENLV